MSSTTQPRPDVDPDLARRLAAVAGRLASPHDGEKLAAVAALQRLLERRGLRLGELLEGLAADRPPRDRDREMLEAVLAEADRLDTWKRRFAESLRPWVGSFTPKQRAKLLEIAASLSFEVRR